MRQSPILFTTNYMSDEGYIKFNPTWHQKKLPKNLNLSYITHFRQALYTLNLIGAYSNDIGYGNISQRLNDQNNFLISGSSTGNYNTLTRQHYSKVLDFNLEKNSLTCEGPIIASSESMSHAVIYQECNWVNGVIHIHHLKMWQKLLHKVPTTDKRATYGSPEMANAIIQLLRETDLKTQRIFVMEGHEEGIFTFGKNLEEAFLIIEKHYHQI